MTTLFLLAAVSFLAYVAVLTFGEKDQGMVRPENLRVVEQPRFYPVVDAHVHAAAEKDAFDLAVRAMDASGVALSMNLSGGSGKALAKSLALAKKHRGRFLTFCGGWPMEFDFKSRQIGLKLAKMIRESHDMGAHGAGEIVKWALHNQINWDDPRLEPMWATLEELLMPVNWHVADPSRYWMPETPFVMLEADDYCKGHPLKHALLMQQDRVLEKFPKLVVIASHANWLNDQIPHLIYRMERYRNYYFDLSAVCDEFGLNPRDFIALCKKYPDRIFFGTDAGYSRRAIKKHRGVANAVRNTKAFYLAHFLFLGTRQPMIPLAWSGAIGQHFIGYVNGFPRYANDGVDLPDSVLRKIYYKNAEKLFGIKVAGWRPPKGFSYEL